jgi:hypothetical protein
MLYFVRENRDGEEKSEKYVAILNGVLFIEIISVIKKNHEELGLTVFIMFF